MVKCLKGDLVYHEAFVEQIGFTQSFNKYVLSNCAILYIKHKGYTSIMKTSLLPDSLVLQFNEVSGGWRQIEGTKHDCLEALEKRTLNQRLSLL